MSFCVKKFDYDDFTEKLGRSGRLLEFHTKFLERLHGGKLNFNHL